MPCLEAVKSFFLKKSFDFDRPDICLYNFHPQLRILLALKGLFFNNQKTPLRLVLPIVSNMLTIVGLVLLSMSIHRGLTTKDYSFTLECFCYFIIITTTPIIYLSLFYNKDHIMQLIKDMNEEFKFICSLGPRYRTPYLEGQLLIWQLSYAWLSLISLTGGMFAIFPVIGLVYQTLFVTHTEDTIRPLSFPMWLPNDDPYRTPNYEIFLFIQITFCVIIVQTFGVYVYTLFHILLHCYFTFDMVILDLEVIFDGLNQSVVEFPLSDPRRKQMHLTLRRRIERIVTWHKSVIKKIDTVSIVYGPNLVYQLSITSVYTCLIAYKIAENLEDGTINFLFIMLAVCACVQLWIPCYLGTLLRNKGFSIADACWNCGWHKNCLGRLIRLDIMIIILRAQEPLIIKFTGLSNIELETFSKVMSAAYSYFNMMRSST